MTKVLLIADAHIKSRTWTNSMALYGDAYKALEKIEQKITEMPEAERPTVLAVAGDWFDSNRPKASDIAATCRFKKLFKEIFYINGNHDSANDPSWFGAETDLDTAYRLHMLGNDGSYELGQLGTDFRVYGIPWVGSRAALAGHLGTCPKTDHSLTLMHAGLKELIALEDTWQLCLEDLNRRYVHPNQLIVVGHIHKDLYTALDGGGHVLSPGSLYPVAWDQHDGFHGACVLDTETMDVMNIWTVPRDYCEWKLGTMEEFVNICEELIDQAKTANILPPCIRLYLPKGGADKFDPAKVPEGVVVLPVSEEQAETAPAQEIAGALTLEQAVGEELSYDADLADMGMELVRAEDPLQLTEQWLRETGVARVQTK